MLPCKAPHVGGALMLYGYGLDALQQRHSGQSRTGEECSDWTLGTAMLSVRACVRACVCVCVKSGNMLDRASRKFNNQSSTGWLGHLSFSSYGFKSSTVKTL